MLIYMLIYIPLVGISTPNMGIFVNLYMARGTVHRTKDTNACTRYCIIHYTLPKLTLNLLTWFIYDLTDELNSSELSSPQIFILTG